MAGDILKNLKSFFIVEEPVPGQEDAASKPSQGSRAPAQNHKAAPVQSGGSIDTAIQASLLEAIDKNNLEGFDYFEFRKSIQALQTMGLDEATVFKTAFATASTMGITLKSLLESAQHYKDILQKEHKAFHDTFDSQVDEHINQKEKEITRMNEQVQQHMQTIQQLNDEIRKNQEQIAALRQKITEASSQINITQNNFQATYTQVLTGIESDIYKMQQHIKQ